MVTGAEQLISRGVKPCKIVENGLWWHGPNWLVLPQSQWPIPLEIKTLTVPFEVLTEYKVHLVSVKRELRIGMPDKSHIRLIDYTHNIGKLIRIIVYVKRFIKKRVFERAKRPKELIPIELAIELNERPTNEEKRIALRSLIRLEQKAAYPRECAFFSAQGETLNYVAFPAKSQLISMRPFMDKDGLIRVGGRISKADIPYDQKHPVILPPKSRLCELLIHEAHCATEHGSIQIMTQYLRTNYWIPLLRNELRMFLRKCVVCARFNKVFEEQLMSDLPTDRVQENVPFTCVGVDYAGPI